MATETQNVLAANNQLIELFKIVVNQKRTLTLWSILAPFAAIFPLETWIIRSGFFNIQLVKVFKICVFAHIIVILWSYRDSRSNETQIVFATGQTLF